MKTVRLTETAGADPGERLARLERQGLIERATTAPPLELLSAPPPAAKAGASVLAALLSERLQD